MILPQMETPSREKAGVKLFSEWAVVGVPAFRHADNAINLTEGGWYAI